MKQSNQDILLRKAAATIERFGPILRRRWNSSRVEFIQALNAQHFTYFCCVNLVVRMECSYDDSLIFSR